MNKSSIAIRLLAWLPLAVVLILILVQLLPPDSERSLEQSPVFFFLLIAGCFGSMFVVVLFLLHLYRYNVDVSDGERLQWAVAFFALTIVALPLYATKYRVRLSDV